MSYPPQAVGTGSYAYALACGLADGGYEPLVVAPSVEGDRAFDTNCAFAVGQLARHVQRPTVACRTMLAGI